MNDNINRVSSQSPKQGIKNMSVTEAKTIAMIIRNTWKQLALADQTDADELIAIIKEQTEALEAMEAGE